MSSSLSPLEKGVVPPGRYAHGGRSPIVWALLCPWCGGYAPTTDPGYHGRLSGRCAGCGIDSRELHRFPAYIASAEGCSCNFHEQITGDLRPSGQRDQ